MNTIREGWHKIDLPFTIIIGGFVTGCIGIAVVFAFGSTATGFWPNCALFLAFAGIGTSFVVGTYRWCRTLFRLWDWLRERD